jgi:hypothetical protein
MIKRILPLLIGLSLVAAQRAPSAEQKPSDKQGEQRGGSENVPVWRALLPGGTYIIAQDAINSISSHEYILDATARVTEVNISTSGSMQARFYFIEPFIPQLPVGQAAVDRATDAAAAAAAAASAAVGDDAIWMKVGKTYPTTTHAGTVEYRLESKEELAKLFQSLERAWSTGRSETFRSGAVASGRGQSNRGNRRERQNPDPAASDAAGGNP